MEKNEEYLRLAELFVGFSVLWLSFGSWWVINTWIWNERHSKPLQSLMTYVLAFKCLHVMTTCAIYASEFQGIWFPYWRLAMSASFTFYNTFTYTSFILISKGFCITRDLITSQEASSLALLMAAVYFAFSAYVVDPGHLSIVLLACLITVQYCVISYTDATISRIRGQLIHLALSNIYILMQPARHKLAMMTDFWWLIWIYFFTQAAVDVFAVTMLPWLYDDYSVVYWTSAFDECFEFMCIGVIFYVFRARYHGQYFNIELSGQLAAPASIAQVYRAVVNGENSGNVLQLPRNAPVVIIPPLSKLSPRELGLMVGLLPGGS